MISNAGIIAVTQRMKYVQKLKIELGFRDFTPKVFLDGERQGNWYNLSRAFKWITENTDENAYFILMCDDAKPCVDWQDKLIAINQKQESLIYSMFCRKPHFVKQEYIDQGFYHGPSGGGFYDVAHAWKNDRKLITEMFDWIDSEKKNPNKIPANKNRHLDICIEYFLKTHEIPIVITMPSLFNTRDIPSVIGHGAKNDALLSFADRTP